MGLPAAPNVPEKPSGIQSNDIGRLLAVFAAGAVGGVLFWILCRWTKTPLPATFSPIATFFAVVFVAALAAAFGVYLLTASDLQSMKTYVFAIACGLLWQSVLSSVQTFVANATAVSTASEVKAQTEKLSTAASAPTGSVAPEIQNTQSTLLQAVKTLASTTDTSGKNDISQNVQQAIGTLQVTADKDPSHSIAALQQVAVEASRAGQSASAIRAIDTLRVIGTQAAHRSDGSVRDQAVNALQSVANQTDYVAKSEAESGWKAIPNSAPTAAQAPALHLEKVAGDGQNIPTMGWANFQVKVVDQGGAPVAAQKVSWQTPAGGLRVYVAQTDAQGLCSATNLYTFPNSGHYIQLATLVDPATPVGFSTADQVRALGPTVSFTYTQ